MARLTFDDLLEVARRTVGQRLRVRDLGLLSAALARVEARVDGRDVYPTPEERAAALLHSLVMTEPLVEGNRPFAWTATAVYLARCGQPSTLTDEEAVALVTDVVTARLQSAGEIAERLRGGDRPPGRAAGSWADIPAPRSYGPRHGEHARGHQPGSAADRARPDRR